MVKLGFKKLHPEAQLPEYAHEGDAGMDVRSIEDVDLHCLTPTLVHTGLAAEIPPGYEIQVRPRSGLALKTGVTVWNSPGCVDSNYRGEIGVILLWTPYADGCDLSSYHDGTWPVYKVKKGDRIAQLVLAPVATAEIAEVEEISDTNRGAGGFGSTGK